MFSPLLHTSLKQETSLFVISTAQLLLLYLKDFQTIAIAHCVLLSVVTKTH